MQTTKRARTEQAKLLRIKAILSASSAALETTTLNNFTVNEVARRTNLSKPAIYNYFSTREEILLQLYRESLNDWMHRLQIAAFANTADLSAEQFDTLFVDSFIEDPLLMKLTPHLVSTFEQNISAQTYITFKRETAEISSQFAKMLVKINRATPDNCNKLAIGYMTILVGAVQIAAPTPFPTDALPEDVGQFAQILSFRDNCLNVLRLLS